MRQVDGFGEVFKEMFTPLQQEAVIGDEGAVSVDKRIR